MNNIYWILLIVLLSGCKNDNAKLNDIIVKFKSFPLNETLNFESLSDSIPDLPSKMWLHKDNLYIQTFCQARDKHIVIYSLKEKQIIGESIKYGSGPNELLSCEGIKNDNDFWIYDMMKKQISVIQFDSLLSENPIMKSHKIDRYYYRVSILNDSTLIGTNDLQSNHKLSFVDLITGKTKSKGKFSYIDSTENLSSIIDAYSCYIDINPKTKNILLTYRYTDVIEIYNASGELIYSRQGPDCFDVEFKPSKKGMRKTQNTRKAFVNSFVTENNIYLLYSGCKRGDENWSYGSEIFVYSWDGIPIKRYLLEAPIYTFAVDEKTQKIYSYSIKTEQLIVSGFS